MKFTIDPKCIRRGPKELRLLAEAMVMSVKRKLESTPSGTITCMDGVYDDYVVARNGRAGMYCLLEIDKADWGISICIRLSQFKLEHMHFWCGYAQARIEDLLHGIDVPINENISKELEDLEKSS